jgi:hypothetical protein
MSLRCPFAPHRAERDLSENVGPWFESWECPGCREHDLGRQNSFVKARFQQQMLVSKSPWMAPSIKDYSPPFLFQLRETLNGKDLRFFSHKKRVGVDSVSDFVCFHPLLQFDIDVTPQSSIRCSYFGTKGILHPDDAPGHDGVAETDARVMPRLRRSPRRQQGKPRAEDREGARIPARHHDGRRPMMEDQLVDRFLMRMERISMQRGAFDDRNSMLKNLRRGLHDGVRWHADEPCVDIPRLADVGCHWNVSERLRELPPGNCCTTHDRRQTEIVAQGDEFRADLSDPAIPDDSETPWFHG